MEKLEREYRFNTALEYIFSEAFNELPATKLVAALLAVSLYDEQVRHAVKTLYDSFHLGLDQELKQHIPEAPEKKRSQAAYTIMCLSFGGWWMRNIGFDANLNIQNKLIAQKLIEQLQ